MLILVNGFTEQCVTVSEKTNVFWRCLRRANKVVNFRLVGGGGGSAEFTGYFSRGNSGSALERSGFLINPGFVIY